MKGEKKTEVLTIRLPASTKKAIEAEAERQEWSPSKVAEKILSTWAESKNHSINVIVHNNETININRG